jgi:hypothetical protein
MWFWPPMPDTAKDTEAGSCLSLASRSRPVLIDGTLAEIVARGAFHKAKEKTAQA